MLYEYSSEQLVAEIIRRIGDDPQRKGIEKTPERVVKSWRELFGGYDDSKLNDLFTVFEEEADEMIVSRGIEFYTTCEHHMLPFYGTATIGYIPRERVIGASKLARVLDHFARRLQIQERIGKQVTTALMERLSPRGCGIVIEAKHLCMCARGVRKQGATFITSDLQGVFREAAVRAEFLALHR